MAEEQAAPPSSSGSDAYATGSAPPSDAPPAGVLPEAKLAGALVTPRGDRGTHRTHRAERAVTKGQVACRPGLLAVCPRTHRRLLGGHAELVAPFGGDPRGRARLVHRSRRLQGRQARRYPGRGTHQVPTDHKPQDRGGPQLNNPAVAPPASGSGDRVETRSLCQICDRLGIIPDHSGSLQRKRPSEGSPSTASSYAYLHGLRPRSENPGVGGSIPSQPTIHFIRRQALTPCSS